MLEDPISNSCHKAGRYTPASHPPHMGLTHYQVSAATDRPVTPPRSRYRPGTMRAVTESGADGRAHPTVQTCARHPVDLRWGPVVPAAVERRAAGGIPGRHHNHVLWWSRRALPPLVPGTGGSSRERAGAAGPFGGAAPADPHHRHTEAATQKEATR
jgi:hypothetical protein